MPVSPAKFDLNRCNESPLRGEKPDFWPLSKNNTGSLPLRGNPAGKNRTFCWKYHWRISKWTRAVESWAKRQRGSKATSLDEAVRQLYAPYILMARLQVASHPDSMTPFPLLDFIQKNRAAAKYYRRAW